MHSHQQKWDLRFLQLAALVATWSKDPSTKVGAVIVDEKNRVISLGYNGFARGVEDRPDMLEHRGTKLKGTLHAEDNAILFARRDLTGCTIYTYPLPPCGTCASRIRQVGINRVVSIPPEDRSLAERWQDDLEFAKHVYGEGVEVVLYPNL